MKIQKFNESKLTNDILYNFIENVMGYVYKNEKSSMTQYNSYLSDGFAGSSWYHN